MHPNTAALRLFVSDLPETTDAMLLGGVYAMIAETLPARFPILAGSLAGVVAAGVPATLMLPSDPGSYLERLSQLGFRGADAAIETGLFQVFQFEEDFSKNIFRFGAQSFVGELDSYKLPEQSYLVIEQADELMSLHDIALALEQAEVMEKWAKKHQITILLVFTRAGILSNAQATLSGLMDYLSGIVRLGGRQDGLDLTFEYWQSPDGTIAAKVYGLAIKENGQYRVRKEPPAAAMGTPPGASVTPTATETEEPDEAPAQLRYLYMDAAFGSLAQQTTGQWQQCDSVVGIIRAAFGARAPTVLLAFERGSVLRDLAEAVHTLRLSLGKRARIVVIEREASLRYPNEILLLRLGTSLVVNRDVQEGRIGLMLESLRGQVFNRDIEMNFDAALGSVATSSRRGYLPPAAFARETAGIVERSNLLNLPCALVLAAPQEGMSGIDLLSKLRVTRAGDLTTTDGRLCYLFFSGCPQSSLNRALQAVLGEATDSLLRTTDMVVSRPEISQRLKALASEVQGKTFPEALAVPDLTAPDRTVSDPAVPTSAVGTASPPLPADAAPQTPEGPLAQQARITPGTVTASESESESESTSTSTSTPPPAQATGFPALSQIRAMRASSTDKAKDTGSEQPAPITSTRTLPKPAVRVAPPALPLTEVPVAAAPRARAPAPATAAPTIPAPNAPAAPPETQTPAVPARPVREKARRMNQEAVTALRGGDTDSGEGRDA